MIQRSTVIIPGYDCREQCQHEIQGQHGVNCDRWCYVVKDMDRRVALEFTVATPNYPASVVERSFQSRCFTSSFLCWHYAHPTTREEVLGSPQECRHLGKCYRNSGSALYEDSLFQRIFVAPADPKDPTQPESFWLGLSEELDQRTTQLEVERLADGDLKWKVCTCCHGERVVPV
jgi:hypothetical protein